MNASDIIMQPYDRSRQLWISHRAVVELCGVSDVMLRNRRVDYKKGVKNITSSNFLPDTGKAWRYAKHEGAFYYCYDNIPCKAPAFHRSKLPTTEELNEILSKASKAAFDDNVRRIEQLVATAVDNSVIRYYMYNATPTFSPDKARELATAKAWCDIICTTLMSKHTDYGIKTLADLWIALSGLIPKMEGLRISSPEYVRKLIARYQVTDDKLGFFVSKHYGNQRARVVGTMKIVHPETGEIMPYDIHESLFYSGFMNPFGAAKYSKIHIYDNVYTPACVNFGIEPLDYRTLCHYTERFDKKLLMTKERHGEKHFNDSYKPYIPAQSVRFANSIWVADGSGSKLAYQAKVKEKGRIITKQKTLYMVRIYDAASHKIVGYAIGENETPELVRIAIEMAVRNSGNMECLELLTDNGSAFSCNDSQTMFAVLFRRVRTIKPGNSQANYAETLVRLTTQHARIMDNEYDNFTMSSFEAKSIESQSNFDYFDSVSKLPTMNEAYNQLVKLVESWNSTPWGDGITPDERFKNINPECKLLPETVLRFAFGHRTKTDISYQRGFVNVEKNGDNYRFVIPDYHVNIEHISKKLGYTSTIVDVRFDSTTADLYTPEGAYIISCPIAQLASRSTFESTDDNRKALGEHQARKNSLSSYADKFRDSVVESTEALPYGVLCKGSKSVVKDDFNDAQEQEMFKQITSKRANKNSVNIAQEAFNQL